MIESKMSVEYFLKSLPFFKDLSNQEINLIVNSGQIKEFDKKEVIFSQESKASNLYVIETGWVKLYQNNLDGEEVILSLLTRSDVFGEASLVKDSKYLHMAETVKDSRIIIIPSSLIKEISQINGAFAFNMVKNLSYQMQSLQIEKSHMAIMTTSQRICCLLLQISIDSRDDKEFITLPYDKNLAAAKLGMKPETFSRSLKKLKKLGISVKGSNIYIEDKKILEDFCCTECSSNLENCFLAKKNCNKCN